MKKPFTFFRCSVFIMWLLASNAQETSPYSINNGSRLHLEDFSYPQFMNGEVHASFLLNYRLTNKSLVEMQGFYDTYLLADRFRTSLVFKHYLTQNLSVFSGLELELERIKMPQWMEIRPPRLGAIGGLGYDVNSGFSLEAKSNIGINRTSMGAYGYSAPMPKVFTLAGKIKF